MTEQPKRLLEQSDALNDFFESLLRDVEAYDEHTEDARLDATPVIDEPDAFDVIKPLEEEVKPFAEAIPDTSLFETLPSVEPSVVADKPVTPIPEIMLPTESLLEPVPDEIASVSYKEQITELPEWCQHEFQAMLFKVAGLTLAVPLVDLNGVVVCELDKVTSMPGHADFYLGLLNHLDKNVPLVDTARFVLPADKLASLTDEEPHARITRAVMINDCQYGLACDEVNDVITLQPDAVRWRTQRTSRRWLAGTVVEHMCALIDASAFAALLSARIPIQDFRE